MKEKSKTIMWNKAHSPFILSIKDALVYDLDKSLQAQVIGIIKMYRHIISSLWIGKRSLKRFFNDRFKYRFGGA